MFWPCHTDCYYDICCFLHSLHSTSSFYTISLSGNKENIGVTSLGSQNTSQNVSPHADWVQCTPATPVALTAPHKKASWELAADEVLVECLQQQQAAGHQLDTGFKPVAWTACVLTLKDSEKQSGGSLKTAKGCKDHFGTVGAILYGHVQHWSKLLPAQGELSHGANSSRPLGVWLGWCNTHGDCSRWCVGLVPSSELILWGIHTNLIPAL